MKAHDVNATWQLEINMQGPFDFARTVAKPAGWHWSTPREIFSGGTLWSGTYLKEIPVGLKMSAKAGRVRVEAYTQLPLDREEKRLLQDDLKLGLGADEDLEAFYAVAYSDTILSSAVQDLYGMRAGRLDDVFGRVILAITLQMAPLTRSRQMMAKLLSEYGTSLRFDGREVTLWPTPADVAALEPAELRGNATLGYRADRLINAARYLTDHPISLQDLADEPEDRAIKKIMEIPGIGPYSARLILGRNSAPIDVWSVVILSELLLGRTPTHPRQEIGEVAQAMNNRWGAWSWIAFVYIFNDLPALSRRYKLSRLT